MGEIYEDTCLVPQTWTLFGDCNFTVATAQLWNSLPVTFCCPDSTCRIQVTVEESRQLYIVIGSGVSEHQGAENDPPRFIAVPFNNVRTNVLHCDIMLQLTSLCLAAEISLC